MTNSTAAPQPHGAGSIDPRGPRFTASVTAAVLIAALLSPRWISVAILTTQALFFTIGVWRGVQFTPTGIIFRRFIRPRLAPSGDFEDARPPRFAQGVGLAFAVVAVLGYASGSSAVGALATGFALVAALLNAVFGLCLGCELYLLVRRAGSTPTGTQASPSPTQDPTAASTEFHNNQKKEAIA